MLGGANPVSCPNPTNVCWVLLGPTASGKTAVSLDLAEKYPLEIVSVDSMQVYRDMDIGTAKPSEEQLRRVPHHMIDVVEPEEQFNVARYREMALEAMQGIRSRGRRPLLICGTPFYLKALLWGLFEGPGADEEVRRGLRREAEQHGTEHLHRRLAEVDPESADRIDPNDMKRIERALEVYELTGRPISQKQSQFEGEPEIDHVSVGLNWPREKLYERISRRVDRMMNRGLVEEVESLRGRLGPQASQAVGYKEIVSYLEGEIDLEEAVRLVKRNTRHLAKSQLSWFRRFPVREWIDISCECAMSQVTQRCEERFPQLTRR
jgi:tRNA dimethylallyltransferase